MRWNLVTYENGMDHAVTDALLPVVLGDMAQKDPPGIQRDTRPLFEWFAEQPGMAFVDRPIELLAFADLRLLIPSEDLGDLVHLWSLATPVSSARDPRGTRFYRFASHPWRCLALDPQQRDDLLDLLRARVDQADQRIAQFIVGRETPQEMLRARDERLLGKERSDEIPRGPDKLARFRPEGSGTDRPGGKN